MGVSLALVEDYSELKKQKKKLDGLKRRNLGAEKAALKEEYREEKGKLKALKTSMDEDTADTMGAEVNRRGMLDIQIKESQARLDTLYEARQKNIEARMDAKAESKKSASSPIQKCPDQCASHDLVVKCSHEGGRRKAIAAPGSKTQELQVVSVPYGNLTDTDTDVDEISVYIAGNCNKGKTTVSAVSGLSGLPERNEEDEHCPYIRIGGGAPTAEINLPGTAGNPLTFNAYSPKPDWYTGFVTKPSWLVFIQSLFFTDAKDKYCTYLIEGASCDGPGSNAVAEVHAFTREKWTMEAAFSWGRAKASDLDTGQNLSAKSSQEVGTDSLIKTQWSIEGKATGNLGTDNFVLEAKPDFLKNVMDSMSHLLYFLSLADEADKKEDKSESKKSKKEVFTWSWIPPKIAIAAERELKENPENNRVDMEYKYAIKMDPFFGVAAKLDVLQVLVQVQLNLWNLYRKYY